MDRRACSPEKGTLGIVILVVVGLLVLAGSAAFFVLRSSGADVPAPVEGATGEESSETPDETASPESVAFYPGGFYTSGSGLYYRTYSPGGRPVAQGAPAPANTLSGDGAETSGEYKLITGANPATFSEIRSVMVPGPVGGSEPTYMTYYRDDDQIFTVVETQDGSGGTYTTAESTQADPDSFQVLSDTYAKDDTHVYVVSWVCTGEECTMVLEIVDGADPDSFHAFEDTQMQQSDGEGTVVADAADESHLYLDGEIVDTILQPGSYINEPLYIHGP